MVLLHLVRWLRDNTDLDFEILLLAGGPLTSAFAEVAPTTCVEALGTGSATYFEAGIARAGFPRASDRIKLQRVRRGLRSMADFDAVYLNSTTSALALRVLPHVPPVVFSHIHELDSAFTYWFPEHDRRAMLEATDLFIACSDGVARNLTDRFDVSPDRVSRHYEFIDVPEPDPSRAKRLRYGAGIASETRLVGGSGNVIWRKGPDLFIQMASLVVSARPDLDVEFVWIGGESAENVPVDQDIDAFGLRGKVHFIGEVTSPGDVYADLDVFCLTSREDPYPLVMLEAASLGVPVVSMANGGAVEFAQNPTNPDKPRAAIVDYLDLETMASTVIGLLDDEQGRKELGQSGRDRVLSEHTIAIGAAGIHREILDHMDPGAGRSTTSAARRVEPSPRTARVPS